MRLFIRNVATAGSLWFLVSACSPTPEVARYTVPEYQADAQLREQQLSACAKDPGTLGKTPDCVNAKQAQFLQDTRSLRDSPSLGLSSGAGADDENAGRPEPQRVPPN